MDQRRDATVGGSGDTSNMRSTAATTREQVEPIADPTRSAQVPVSLLRTVRAAMDMPNLSWSTRQDIYRRLDALIAQPTDAELSEQMYRHMVQDVAETDQRVQR